MVRFIALRLSLILPSCPLQTLLFNWSLGLKYGTLRLEDVEDGD